MSLISPAEMKKHNYKYYHKAARVAKKERQWAECLENYFKYAVNKVKYKL